MVWWLFKKKRHKHEEKLDELIRNLQMSFSNIKKDIAHIHERIKQLDESDSKIVNKLAYLDSSISNLEPKLNKIEGIYFNNKIIKEKQIKAKEEVLQNEVVYHKNILSSLTTTQQELFKTIYSIQQQLETEDISIKSLAKVYYPDKKYEDVRSTISEYLTMLSTLGLVNKKRKGKEAYASLTKTGSQIINKLKIKFEEKNKMIEENGNK